MSSNKGAELNILSITTNSDEDLNGEDCELISDALMNSIELVKNHREEALGIFDPLQEEIKKLYGDKLTKLYSAQKKVEKLKKQLKKK